MNDDDNVTIMRGAPSLPILIIISLTPQSRYQPVWLFGFKTQSPLNVVISVRKLSESESEKGSKGENLKF